MKKIYTLLFTFCFCFAANGQNTFEKIIDTLGFNAARCVQQTYDGGYVACGTSYFGNNDAAIVKLDSLGAIQWAKIYGGSGMDAALRIEQLPDSGYIVTGQWDSGLYTKNWLLRLNGNGDTLWTEKYSALDKIEPQGSITFKNNNLAVTGSITKVGGLGNTYFLKTDSSGNLAASKIYLGGIGSQGNDITTADSNGFAIVGGYSAVSLTVDVILYRIDSMGDTLWTKRFANSYQNGGNSIQQTSDSGFILAGLTLNISNLNHDVYLIKTDANGDTMWTKVIFYPLGNTAQCIRQITSSNYIITGRIVDTLSIVGKLLLIKTDSYGDTLWTKHFDGVYSAQGYFVRQTSDGGFIIGGETGSSTVPLSMYIIKTDSMGNVISGVGINEINKPVDISVFPNPGRGLFNINFKNTTGKTEIEVFNNLGKKIYSCLNEICDGFCVINLSAEPDGLYIVTVKNQTGISSEKLLLMK